MLKLKYLITGTGRCGTVFMARFLTSLGLPCGHESFFDWRGVDCAVKRLKGDLSPELSHASKMSLKDGKWVPESEWIDLQTIVAESSYMAVPFLNHECLTDVPIIHVVRDPIKVVNSFCNHIDYFRSEEPNNSYEKFIYSYLPELKLKMSYFDRTALFVTQWNSIIEKHKVAFFYRVEDPVDKLMQFIDKSGETYSNSTINTYKKWVAEPFYLHKIESKEIRQNFIDMGRRYGYRMGNVLMN